MIGSLLRRLFGPKRPPSAPKQRSDRDETAAGPLPETPPFLQREPLLNRQQRIAGYLFSIQHPRGQRPWQASSEQFFDRVLIERLAALDLDA